MREGLVAQPRSKTPTSWGFSPVPSAIKKRPDPGLNHSSLTVASRRTMAPSGMDFTLPLYSQQNRKGTQEGGGLQLGGLRDLWPTNLHFVLGLCFCFTGRMSKAFFLKKLYGLTVSDLFFSLVTVQHFQQTLEIHSCMSLNYHKDVTISGHPLHFAKHSPMKLAHMHSHSVHM